jgi:hypothetical protein
MPTKSRRENGIVKRFLIGYERGCWADANVCWMDEILDNAVEQWRQENPMAKLWQSSTL